MILSSLLELGAVLVSGGALVIFGQRIVDGRTELKAPGHTRETATVTSWQEFHESAGKKIHQTGVGVMIVSLVATVLWLLTRNDLYIAGNWLIGGFSAIWMTFATSRSLRLLESR